MALALVRAVSFFYTPSPQDGNSEPISHPPPGTTNFPSGKNSNADILN